MKSKYMSRKFLLSLAGLGVSLYALSVDNTIVAVAGMVLAGCFVIGESIVDKAGAIHRQQTITVVDHKENKVD